MRHQDDIANWTINGSNQLYRTTTVFARPSKTICYFAGGLEYRKVTVVKKRDKKELSYIDWIEKHV